MRTTKVLLLTLTALATCPALAATYTIGGTTFYEGSPSESITASFLMSNGGFTSGLFDGFVLLEVSGTGQSLGSQQNDAFYVYTDGAGNPITPTHFSTNYQLAVDTVPLVGDIGMPTPADRNAKNFIFYDVDAGSEVTPVYVPSYRSDHVYRFIIDVRSTFSYSGSASTLNFGVNDGNFGDNAGQYAITVTQLQAIPEPGTFVLIGTAAVVLFAARVSARRR